MLKQLINEISVFDILFFLGIILILVALLQKNSNFLDVRKIICQHLSIFSKNPLQVVAIFGAPLLIAIAAAATHPLTAEIVNNLNVVLSILISMFFAMLSILATLNYKSTDQNKVNDITLVRDAEKYNKVLKQTINAILFESILAILLLIVSFSQLFIGSFDLTLKLRIISAFVYYLTLVLVLNIFVVIKRIKSLLDSKSKSSE